MGSWMFNMRAGKYLQVLKLESKDLSTGAVTDKLQLVAP